jgi:hypothetical protein
MWKRSATNIELRTPKVAAVALRQPARTGSARVGGGAFQQSEDLFAPTTRKCELFYFPTRGIRELGFFQNRFKFADMKTSFLFVLATAACLTGCGEKSSSNSTPTNSTSGNPLTAPVDYLGAIGKAQQHAVKTIDVASITQAIQLFQADRGRFPKDLNELVKERFLGKIPEAPYGSRIDYDPTTGQVKVVKQ